MSFVGVASLADLEDLKLPNFGFYVIGGGGWYYCHTSIGKDYVVAPGTACQPNLQLLGYACDRGGYVQLATIASHGTSAGGFNAGVGFTVKIGEPG